MVLKNESKTAIEDSRRKDTGMEKCILKDGRQMLRNSREHGATPAGKV
jgi:hypothetical protein